MSDLFMQIYFFTGPFSLFYWWYLAFLAPLPYSLQYRFYLLLALTSKSLFMKIFIFSLILVAACCFNAETFVNLRSFYNELKHHNECHWTDHCPIYHSFSYPTCYISDEKHVYEDNWMIEVCGNEGGLFSGADFSLKQEVSGNITYIDTVESYNCKKPCGLNTTTFKVHCECDGHCRSVGFWRVFFKKSESATNLIK